MKTKLLIAFALILGLTFTGESYSQKKTAPVKKEKIEKKVSDEAELDAFWKGFQNSIKKGDKNALQKAINFPYIIWNAQIAEQIRIATFPEFSADEKTEYGTTNNFKTMMKDLKDKTTRIPTADELTIISKNFVYDVNSKIYICNLTDKIGYGPQYVIAKAGAQLKVLGYFLNKD